MRNRPTHNLPILAAVLLLCMQQATAHAADTGKQLALQAGLPWPAVIAHRGASHDAPESTAPAYILARELGADYLELDLQRSKDGALVAVHDDTLARTTNVAQVYPRRAADPVSSFTLAELKTLDAGGWFNRAYPERARPSYVGQKILTLDEVIDIAEGGDNKPGLYVETKVPKQFPGIEKELATALARRGWLTPRQQASAGHVDVASLPGRVVLQTFEKSSFELLQQAMPQVPKVLLLWLGDDYIPARPETAFKDSGMSDKAAFYARRQVRSQADFIAWIDWAKHHGAWGSAPSAALAGGGEQSYSDLTAAWMNQASHERGLFVHAYTVDAPEDFARLRAAGVDGFFSNRPDRLLIHLQRTPPASVAELLQRNGF